MNTLNADKAIIPLKYAVPIFLALTCAGLAGNYFRYEIFFNIQFIFGSIFAMLALQALGFGPGILAAALISSMTYHLWNHPYAIIIMTGEVLAVGYILRSKNIGLVFADALYWICIGMPLVYFFYHGVMHLSTTNALITMVKQALNGIANALFARLVFIALSRKTAFSFREIIFNLLGIFIMVPSLLLLTLESRTDFIEADRTIRESLLHTSKRAEHNLEQWIENHLTIVTHLADMAATSSLSHMQHSIENIQTSDKDFLRMGLLDKNATIIAYSPLIDEMGQANIGKNFADRPFIPVLKRTLKPMLSEIVMGRIGKPKPMVTMLAPVISRKSYAGYITGILDLKGVQNIIEIESEGKGMLYTLLDKNGRIIVSNRNDLKIMDMFSRPAGDLQQLDNGLFQWIPFSKINISISERWKSSSYVKNVTIGAMAEWKLILEQPLAPFQEKLYMRYSKKLGLLLLILVIALAIAEILSRKIIVSLEQLKELSTDLPQKLLSGEHIAWSSSNIMETERLIKNFRDMSSALSDKFNEIKRINVTLETQVKERTRDLEMSEERYRNLFENNHSIMLVIDPQSSDIVDANPAASAYYGWSRAELKRKNMSDINTLSPEEISAEMARANDQSRNHFFFLHRLADGTIRDVEVYTGPILTGGRTLLFSIVHDITERKQAEEQIFRSLKEKEVLLKEIHHRVKNNMQVIYSLLNLQAKSIADPAVRAMFEEGRNRVNSMAMIHEKLYRSADLAHIDFKEYLQGLVKGIADTYKRRDVVFSVEMENIALDVNIGIPCGLIVNELVSNSLKHAFPDGRKGTIRAGISKNSQGAFVLTVADNGIGFQADIDFRNTSSLGLQLVNVLTGQLNGTIELSKSEGTFFSITFPGT